MTPTEQDKELYLSHLKEVRELLEKYAFAVETDEGGEYLAVDIDHITEPIMQLMTADRKRVALEARIDPFDFVEPCEPDCDNVRHAYHQGQWDMATRIEAKQEEE